MKSINPRAIAPIIEKISQAENILCISHKNPDGDALGSSLGMYHFLKTLGKKVSVVLPNALPRQIDFLPSSDAVLIFDKAKEESAQAFEDADCVLCLDFNHPSRIGGVQSLLEKHMAKAVMVDHHLDPANDFPVQWSSPSTSSTSEMVMEILCEMQTTIPLESIECCYTGMVTDTASFRFASVTSRTLHIVAYMMDNGLNHAEIQEKIYNRNRLSRLRLLGHTLSQNVTLLQEKLAIMHISDTEISSFECRKTDTEGFVHHALSIEGVEIAIFCLVYREFNSVKLSFRSQGQWAVNEISKKWYSGGGHRNAAGGTFEGTLEEFLTHFKENVLPELQAYHGIK